MIEIKDLKKTLNKKLVLKDVNLFIPENHTMVIIGRSGSGKSVLLKHLIGIHKPDSGKIYVHGIDITQIDRLNFFKKNIKIAVLFQNSALFDSMNIEDNVGFYLERYASLTETERAKVVAEKLDMVGLKGVEKLMPFELSGGMQKRAALARALVIEPAIMLYDEPTTGLDPITAENINKLIVELQHNLKITSIVVTHDMISAYHVGDRIAMLNDGVIIENTPVEEFHLSSNSLVQEFIKNYDLPLSRQLEKKGQGANYEPI